ncbi:MAG: hypothetical protein AAGC97_08700 [Planctomycetota bacterium]
MKRVLIVSPNFPPTNGADMHRVRITVPHMRDFGWDPEVLCVDPRDLRFPQDPWLEGGLPDWIPIHRIRALGTQWATVPGMGHTDARAYRRMLRKGHELLSEKPFDLIYFSTTSFRLHGLGPSWLRKWSVPFAMDYQDPWVNDYYSLHPEKVPPGGRLKYAVQDRISRYMEPRVLARCSGYTSVSPSYPEQLRSRYPQLSARPAAVLPFPGCRQDLERVATDPSISQSFFPKSASSGCRNWVYVGRGGEDLGIAASAFFAALRRWRETSPQDYQKTRVHLIGTSYAPAGKGTPTLVPLAREHGVSDIVSESTDRVPYSMAIKCLLDADALVVFGSNDPSYTASKIYPYLLARKPLLTIFHGESTVNEVIDNVGGATAVSFDESMTPQALESSIFASWFENHRHQHAEPVNDEAFRPYTDQGSAELLCLFFDEITERQPSRV